MYLRKINQKAKFFFVCFFGFLCFFLEVITGYWLCRLRAEKKNTLGCLVSLQLFNDGHNLSNSLAVYGSFHLCAQAVVELVG